MNSTMMVVGNQLVSPDGKKVVLVDQIVSIRPPTDFIVLLECNQTKDGDYSSDPTRYHFDNEEEAKEFFMNRAHGEGLNNWLAYQRLCDDGYVVNVEMVER